MSEEQNVPILSRLRAPAGAITKKKRKGRGPGSGTGKTSGKGMKGQKARHGGNFGKIGFEGGQMPIYMRLPKVGFRNPFSKNWATINIGDLAARTDSSSVSIEDFKTLGVLKNKHDGVKVLGGGAPGRAITIKANAFSAAAKQKIEEAGGTVEIV